MEVASPIPFSRVQTGNKRRFACSPMVDTHRIGADVGVDDFSMVEENSGFGNFAKRRRFLSTEMDSFPLLYQRILWSHFHFPRSLPEHHRLALSVIL